MMFADMYKMLILCVRYVTRSVLILCVRYVMRSMLMLCVRYCDDVVDMSCKISVFLCQICDEVKAVILADMSYKTLILCVRYVMRSRRLVDTSYKMLILCVGYVMR